MAYMTDKELKRLSRVELLELLIGQMKENQRLQAALDAANKVLRDRTIVIEQAGSIAEAALQLNGVFAAAEAAAAQYLENIRRCAAEQEAAGADGQLAAANHTE